MKFSRGCFANQYSLSKTLRFELIPQGSTLENIKKKGFLEIDEERSVQYKLAKKIIDEYHKYFIEKVLGEFSFKEEGLEEYADMYRMSKKEQQGKEKVEQRKKLIGCQKMLRKEIAQSFKKNESYKNLFKKKLIKKDLIEWLNGHGKTQIQQAKIGLESQEPVELIKGFENWTSYFQGFYKNRKNIYSDKEQVTAISYRVVNENLPKFIDNIDRYNDLIKTGINFLEVEENMKDELRGLSLENVFCLSYFNQCLNQEGIDRYNCIRGGKALQDGSKLKGISEVINLYFQEVKNKLNNIDNIDNIFEKKLLEKKKNTLRSCKMVDLYKQILSDQESKSFVLESFESDLEVLNSIKCFYDKISKVLFGTKKIFLENLKEADLDKVYIRNDKSINNISQKIFKKWDLINQALELEAENKFPSGKKKLRGEWLKSHYFSLKTIDKAVEAYFRQLDGDQEEKCFQNIEEPMRNYFSTLGSNSGDSKEQDPFALVESCYKDISFLFKGGFSKDSKKLMKDKNIVSQVKSFLDSVKDLVHFIKPLYIDSSVDFLDKDGSFYHSFDSYYEELKDIVPLYNKVRNYLTQKPYQTEKYKLNFNNKNLLAGWDVNKEKERASVILIKNKKYYLAIMNKKDNKLFENPTLPSGNEESFKKVNYKLLPGPNKTLPRVFIHANKNKDYYGCSEEMSKNYKNGTHTKGDSFNLDHCHQLIDFFKKSIEKYPDWKVFNFKFSPTEKYKNIGEFYKEVARQGYKITYSEVSDKYIQQLVEEGKLYLFQIYNKDFSSYSKGKKNLHTIYWELLFDQKNLSDVVYKLNGKAEVFYRKKSLDYDEKIWRKGHHYEELKEKFKYPIIKDRRYAKDKFLFHVPITTNFKAEGSFSKFNDKVNNFLKNNSDINILGIDRGERHLIYCTLLNQQGDILEQKSFNTIKSNDVEKNYHSLLDKVEGDRAIARKTWGTIDNIKNLKEGYLSQVVHQICKMVIENNAIVVFEDLNFGFKKGRFKVEKQVYQKLEKMLIDKFNFLVLKDRKYEDPGGALCAYQLTAPFLSFKKMGKQSGVIFYVPAYHTSKVCPVTGFVNLLYPEYKSIKQAEDFFKKFNSICYNRKKDYFEFTFDYNKFNDKANGSCSVWMVCSHGERLRNIKDCNGRWGTKEYIPTEEIKRLLSSADIPFDDGHDLKEIIAKVSLKEFLKDMIYALKLTMQMRNSSVGTDNDYLISPVADSKGNFFDSRKAIEALPKNGDANGAYHIGLKGLWVLQRIAEWNGSGKLDLAIKNQDWYNFVQLKDYRKKNKKAV